jgi:hypothetical protein
MTPEEEMALTVQLPGLEDYSRQRWEGTSDSQLATTFLATVARVRQQEAGLAGLAAAPTDEALDRLRIGGTNVCRIMFGTCTCRIVKLDETGTPIENKQRTGLSGILDPQFRRDLQEWTKNRLRISSDPYSDVSLKEAFANAVAHAAYFERDGEIIVEMSSDKLTISNLCVPGASYFANRWFSREHKTFNGLLMETMRLAGHVDELGRGKNVIFRESILGGKKPPQVFVDNAGRFKRWSLTLYGGSTDERFIRLVHRLREIYEDDRKALIAQALILWSKEPVDRIKKYMDGESERVLADVLEHPKCPVIALRDSTLARSRWVQVLLGEGKDSKKFSAAEEMRIHQMASKLCRKYHGGTMTAAQFRDFADMGNTPSEQTLASTTLKSWLARGLVEKGAQRGHYVFPSTKLTGDGDRDDPLVALKELLAKLGGTTG